MFTIPQTTSNERFVTKTPARKNPGNSPYRIEINACRVRRNFDVKSTATGQQSSVEHVFQRKAGWVEKERREGYMEASVEQGIAWQIKINRQRRGLSQSDLAKILNTKQSAVSRLEDTEYGAHSLETLISVAKAFDCALQVRLVSYSQLAIRSEKLTPDDLFAAPFSAEKEMFHG